MMVHYMMVYCMMVYYMMVYYVMVYYMMVYYVMVYYMMVYYCIQHLGLRTSEIVRGSYTARVAEVHLGILRGELRVPQKF